MCQGSARRPNFPAVPRRLELCLSARWRKELRRTRETLWPHCARRDPLIGRSDSRLCGKRPVNEQSRCASRLRAQEEQLLEGVACKLHCRNYILCCFCRLRCTCSCFGVPGCSTSLPANGPGQDSTLNIAADLHPQRLKTEVQDNKSRETQGFGIGVCVYIYICRHTRKVKMHLQCGARREPLEG